jgi:hypothetical protein
LNMKKCQSLNSFEIRSVTGQRRVRCLVHGDVALRPLSASDENLVQKTENKMKWRARIAALCVISAGAALTGCATGSTSERGPTLREQCLAEATSEDERSECSFDDQKRMQGGRGWGSS